MRLFTLIFVLAVVGNAHVHRILHELSPIPCSSQTACMEHAHCVAGRCRCQAPYSYYASQCVAGQPGLSGPLPDLPSNPMIVPAAVPANSFTQPLQSVYDVPRSSPVLPPPPAYQPVMPPMPAVPLFPQRDSPIPPPPPPPAQPPLRVSMNGQTYIMESLVQLSPPPPPPVLAPLQPALMPRPPCIPFPAFPCYYPPPVLLPPVTPPVTTTTFRPLRDPTVTPTSEGPTTITATSTMTTTTTEEPTTTEEITTTTEEETTTVEITTTQPPPITTSVDSILITTTSTLPPITSTSTTTTVRPARDEPLISFPLEPCLIMGTLCVGGSRCMQGICLCRMNEEVIDGECCAIPQPPVIPLPPPPIVYQLNPGCQSQACCQPGFIFNNQQCNPPQPQKIRAFNIVVGARCSNTVQCDRGSYCLAGKCQCAAGYQQLNSRCISLRQLL